MKARNLALLAAGAYTLYRLSQQTGLPLGVQPVTPFELRRYLGRWSELARIDLNEILVTHPQATFLFRVAGDSMQDLGIFDNDLLLVNRALKPCHGNIVLAVVDGEYAVKQLYLGSPRFQCNK